MQPSAGLYAVVRRKYIMRFLGFTVGVLPAAISLMVEL
jgi:hypothetical protein